MCEYEQNTLKSLVLVKYVGKSYVELDIDFIIDLYQTEWWLKLAGILDLAMWTM